MSDLFTEQEDQETKWAVQIRRTRRAFEERVHAAMRFARNKSQRRKYYMELRKEIGDDAAREIAKLVEAVLKGERGYPKWFDIYR